MEVTQGKLAALAGWALTKVWAGGPPAAAFYKLRDACEEAIPFVPVDSTPRAPVSRPPVQSSQPRLTIPYDQDHNHQFDIRSQRCKLCGETYLNTITRR